MLDQRYIFFYSKYSRPCHPILKKLAERNTVLTSVCIDNKSIRSRIEKDTKISLKVVPTILIVYKTGVVEKYEGDRANELLSEMYPEQVQPPSVEYSTQVVAPPIKTQITSETDVSVKEEKPKAETESKKPVVENSLPTSSTTDMTSLLDLDDTSSEEVVEDTEVAEDVAEEENPQQETGRRDNGDNLPIKPDSKVASAAAAIQEERAAMDESLKRGPNGMPKK